MKKNSLVLLLLLAPLALFSQVKTSDLQLNTITTAVPFLAITPDSRAGAMGDAGTALSASANSIYWNTSMLIFSKKKSEIGISYTPWLRQLTKDMHLSYLSGYKKLNDRHVVGASLRYFSLGNITFTDNAGNVLRDDKPSEFELAGAYAFRLGKRMSLGINGKFVYSNLTGGFTVQGVDTKAGVAGAADVSFTYYNDDAKIGNTRGIYTFAATINNIGNKIAYSSTANNDFIPINLKIGNSFKANFDKYNSLVVALDLQKLLVPTPPKYVNEGTGSAPNWVLASGQINDVGVVSGMIQSFYDAPGTLVKDSQGKYVKNADGTYQVESSSKLIEELNEINICLGLEYWYNNAFALRAGYFYENATKGNRQFFNAGVGLKYNKFGVDISFLAAVTRNSPLANTIRFGLTFDLGGNDAAKNDSKPE